MIDLGKHPVTSTKRINLNNSSDGMFQFPPSKEIKLNNELDYPQSLTGRITGNNFPYDNTSRRQLPINLPNSSVSYE
jgi:hypothetical protein